MGTGLWTQWAVTPLPGLQATLTDPFEVQRMGPTPPKQAGERKLSAQAELWWPQQTALTLRDCWPQPCLSLQSFPSPDGPFSISKPVAWPSSSIPPTFPQPQPRSSFQGLWAEAPLYLLHWEKLVHACTPGMVSSLHPTSFDLDKALLFMSDVGFSVSLPSSPLRASPKLWVTGLLLLHPNTTLQRLGTAQSPQVTLIVSELPEVVTGDLRVYRSV